MRFRFTRSCYRIQNGEAALLRAASAFLGGVSLLLQCGPGLRRRFRRTGGSLLGKIIAVLQVSVKLARELGGSGTESRAATFKEEDRHHRAQRRLRVRSEPSEASSFVGARPGLAEDRKLLEVGPQAARSSVLDRPSHAILNIRNELRDIEFALHLGFEASDLHRSRRVLQIIESSTIGERRHERSKLEGGQGHALSKAAHPSNTTLRSWNRLIGIDTQLLARDVIARQLAQSELRSIVPHPVKSKLAAQLLKVEVVAVRQRLRHVHPEARQVHHRVAADDSL